MDGNKRMTSMYEFHVFLGGSVFGRERGRVGMERRREGGRWDKGMRGRV